MPCRISGRCRPPLFCPVGIIKKIRANTPVNEAGLLPWNPFTVILGCTPAIWQKPVIPYCNLLVKNLRVLFPFQHGLSLTNVISMKRRGNEFQEFTNYYILYEDRT